MTRVNGSESTWRSARDQPHRWPLGIALIASGRVDVEPLVTHHFPLDQTREALLLGRTVSDSIKAVSHPQQ